MKTYATPILLVAAVLSLALLLAATTRTGSGRAQAPAGPTALAKALVNPASSPAAGARDRVVRRTYVTRAACFHLFGHSADSHGELGACLSRAR